MQFKLQLLACIGALFTVASAQDSEYCVTILAGSICPVGYQVCGPVIVGQTKCCPTYQKEILFESHGPYSAPESAPPVNLHQLSRSAITDHGRAPDPCIGAVGQAARGRRQAGRRAVGIRRREVEVGGPRAVRRGRRTAEGGGRWAGQALGGGGRGRRREAGSETGGRWQKAGDAAGGGKRDRRRAKQEAAGSRRNRRREAGDTVATGGRRWATGGWNRRRAADRRRGQAAGQATSQSDIGCGRRDGQLASWPAHGRGVAGTWDN
ncbi:hypothetical protein GGX14DRAFT_405981 [Mycena pura]|uniref:Uncharacterized protein n=1 Tax=Mycena pura TaxID=153505 RepID=A0AAD6UUY8_9AGAR|nr:hypothetical protein GGX14DRAFT_405981 [Mycena pura]